jgi:hypothetical protein
MTKTRSPSSKGEQQQDYSKTDDTENLKYYLLSVCVTAKTSSPVAQTRLRRSWRRELRGARTSPSKEVLIRIAAGLLISGAFACRAASA